MRLHSETDAKREFVIPVVTRPRLASAFSFAADVRVVVALAPAGYGKSLAVRSFLSDPAWIHYRVGARAATFARFVRGFAQAVAIVAPGAQASFPRAWERALQSGSPQAVLARWMCEHLQHVAVDLVIDDLHESTTDLSIAEFIAEFVRIRAGRRLAITARDPGLLPIPLWMATGIMDRPIDESQLRFDARDAREFALALDAGAVDAAAVAAAAGGYPVAVTYAINARRNALDFGSPAPAARSFDVLADHIFASRSPQERQFLFSASLLPALQPDLLEACGWTNWSALCTTMERDASFMWERSARGVPCFHDRFADFLATRFATEEPSLRVALARRAVDVLGNAGRYADALHTAVSQRLVAEVDALLDGHGFDILESGRVDEIGDALLVIDASDATAGAGATAIRGYIDARLNRLDTSEAWFRLGLDRASNEPSRVAIALYYAREIMHRLRDDAFEVLEPYADSTTLSAELLIDVRSSLGQAYMVADRVAEARVRTQQALEMLDERCPAALRARVLARAAYVACERGDAEAARADAWRAVPIAVAEGLYDVAASVYTVLYTIAYEIDDDAQACLEYLDCVRDFGVKSGTIRLDLYALVATYELYAEAGDRARLARLDREISAVDVKYATFSFLDSFLPARAMQAGWAGDFGYAFGVLAPTPERQGTPLRQALRWSEVALYAAAAGDRAAAYAASDRVREGLDADAARTTHRMFAALNCALAAGVLGDTPQAKAWLQRAEDAKLPAARRMLAFATAVTCFVDASSGPPGFVEAMAAALAELERCGFGGVALLIESLPFAGGAGTVGARIASHRLDVAFLAATQSSAAQSHLFDELARAWEADVDGRAIRAVLRQWSRPPALDSPRARTVARGLREFVIARSVAPAIVSTFGREDGIDASIDALFADLKLAAPLMAEHSQAVSAWCTRIARRLGLDEDEVAYITRCGLIHDIGKVRTPDEILNAPRRLEPQEWAIMRDHAAEGGRLAAAVPALTGFVPIIRGHHERLDGKGYPDGLRAGAIPLAARIVTVADCFNAMIGRRPYRLPLAPTEALDELDRNRHTQFDPEIVDAMIRIVMGLTPPAVVTAGT